MSFYFLGQGPFSKSLALRALIAQSYFPKLKITGESHCDDALSMKAGLNSLKNLSLVFKDACFVPAFDVPSSRHFKVTQKPRYPLVINCSRAGAVLRFLTLRASRETGEFKFTGSARLFQRPLQELISVLNQLSCETAVKGNSLIVKSRGWRLTGDALTISSGRSSQFASAVFLNGWSLKRDLFVSIEGNMSSFSYFQMTLSFLRFLGMRIEGESGEYCIPAGQKINRFVYHPEPDMSCLFSLSALTGVGDGGEAVFTDFPEQSLQPDFVFPEILSEMGFQVHKEKGSLKVIGAKKLKPIKRNMKNNPDLFPVLSALCALAEGESRLYGAPHLKYKESDRIEQTADLLKKAGRAVTVLKEGLVIEGRRPDFSKKPAICFDPEEDHRMAMASALLKKAGLPVRILNPEVVNKSFPGWWSGSHIKP